MLKKKLNEKKIKCKKKILNAKKKIKCRKKKLYAKKIY